MGKHHFKTAMIILISSIILCSTIPAHLSNAVITEPIETKLPYEQYVSASHTVSRQQAVIDYIQALYSSEEGTFYGWLEDTPTDPRIGSCPSLYNVYDPYTILKQMGSTGVIDWSNCTKFLTSLVNTDPSSIYYDLVNFSQQTSPSTISCDVAIQLFSDFGLGGLIHDDEIAAYIASCQTSNGGFRSCASNDDPAEMITTWCALRALDSIGRLSAIDTSAALSYVLSCYHTDGGFSNVPDVDAIPDIVPLGLFCLNILSRPDLIRTQNTTDYLLQYFDSAGTTSGGTLVNTERFVWSLYTLGTLDQINVTNMLSWVLSCQTHQNGAFLPIPTMDYQTERLEWVRAAVHILYLCDRIDLLNENFTVTDYPEYHIPQWYIDYINKHFGATTDTEALAPYVGIIFLVSLTGVYIIWANKKHKLERVNNATDANK
jgi:prenyltransferase beta subunit